MKKIQYILVFTFLVLIHSTSYAYFGVKAGAIRSGGEMSYGAGVVFGLPIPAVKGLAVEMEESGYYNPGSVVDLFFLQTSVGPVLDFNPMITPDSNFFHPYIRGGLAYTFLFSNNDALIGDQRAPGFFTGAGLTLNFPVVSIGVETNYNYMNFDNTADSDYWSYFLSGGIHF